MARELGVEAVVTDDATDYRSGVDHTGVPRQQCLVHTKRTLGRAKGRLNRLVRPRYARRLLVHLLERWRQLTVYQRQPGVPRSTNWVEGRFGRIKPRCRMTRGLKTDSGTANFMAVVCDVLA